MTSRSGTILGATKVLDHGSRAEKWDLVVLGDGYTLEELPLYKDYVAGLVTAIRQTQPFADLMTAINVTRIDVASSENGAGNLCRGERRATYFDSNFCVNNLERLLVTDIPTALEVALDAVPEMNAAVMIVNSPEYGGSGGAIPTFSVAPGAFQIALHEMGHSHFGLADEYPSLADCNEPGHDRFSGAEPEEVNVTRSLSNLKWKHLLTDGVAIPTTRNPDCSDCDRQASPVPDGTVGAFEGAKYFRCGLFRPEYRCKMRELNDPFCAVCQARIREVLSPFVSRRRRTARR